MQQDLLTELKLPSLDYDGLERIVRQNATRLKYLISTHNIYVNKLKIDHSPVAAGCKDSTAPYFSNFKSDVFATTENIATTKEKTVEQNSVIQNNNNLSDEVKLFEGTKPKIENEPHSTSTTLASNLGWDSNDEDESHSVQNRSYPTRFLCESDAPFSWEPDFVVDASLGVGTNICGESEYLLDAKTVSEEETTSVPIVSEKSISEPQKYDFPSVHSYDKSVRCYSRRRMTDIPSTSETNKNSLEGGEEEINIQQSENGICRISEIMGYADAAFSGNDANLFKLPPITPKKTNDITKIKGWRRKQFFVEKPTTVEYYNFTDEGSTNTIKVEEVEPEASAIKSEIEDHNENAFVCDSLDEFLETDAELKINYEIPHLYAEVGIKLTSEEIVSKPNLSVEDFKEVESKYCMPVPNNSIKVENEDDHKTSRRFMSETELAKLKRQRAVDVKRQLAKSLEKQVNRDKLRNRSSILKNKLSENVSNKNKIDFVKEFEKNFKNVNLASKLIGLVVFPGPQQSLHPLVRLHLLKIRSYRTKIDKNWASFAVSAVVTKNEKPQSKIIPVFCVGKLEGSPPLESSDAQQISVSGTDSVVPLELNKNEDSRKKSRVNISTEPCTKLKKCTVLLDKIKAIDSFRVWCMEHNCYYCSACQLNIINTSANKKSKIKKKPSVESKVKQDKEVNETVSGSKTTIDKTIASLLSKKLKILKSSGDTLTSIDSLKTKTPNAVELIKLNFIKQSFLTGYISIWYLKSEIDSVRSRALLTFSKVPPFPDAIDLQSNTFSRSSLPKVITEIVSEGDTFDSNEYAILHCNGDVWEIHGCLNLGTEKSDAVPKKGVRNVEQIFTPVSLPELPQLQRLAQKLLYIKLSKWWILDLSQKFHELNIKSNPVNSPITRKKLLSFIKSGMFGYVSMKKDDEGRVLGAYIFQKLVPFVLIGPYYVAENHDLSLKVDSTTVPFMYNEAKNASREYPLKFFINSVITEYQETDKRVEGLWLYDKTVVENTCYLEVMTTTEDFDIPKSKYSIHAEHGYSLNTPPTSDSLTPTSTALKSNQNNQITKIVVYLYFEIPELGYLQGELQSDNSVVINHPLDRQTKVKSVEVGEWFLSLIRKRIQFIPKNLQVRWFITRHKEDLRERQPFNKFYLGGAHILCKKGLFFMLQLTTTRIEELGLDKKEVAAAIAKSKVINEVKELKFLANVLCKNSGTENLSMEQVLIMAKKEIQNQEKLKELLAKRKRMVQENKIIKLWRYLRAVNAYGGDVRSKCELVDKVKSIFVNKEGEMNPDFVKCLISFDFGRKYLLPGSIKYGNKVTVADDSLTDCVLPSVSTSKSKSTFLPKGDSIIEELESKLSSIYSMLEVNAASQNSVKHDLLIKKLKAISGQLDFIKSIFGKTPEEPKNNKVKKANSRCKTRGRKKRRNVKKKDSVSTGKPANKGFITLDSSKTLPTNIQVSSEPVVASESSDVLTIAKEVQPVQSCTVSTGKEQTILLTKKINNELVTTINPNTSVLKVPNIVQNINQDKIVLPVPKAVIVNNLKRNKMAIHAQNSAPLTKTEETSVSDQESKLPKRKYDSVDDDEIEVVAEILGNKKKCFQKVESSFQINGSDIS